MITTQDAIDFIAKVSKDTSDENKMIARVALDAAIGSVAAAGGRGWDFTSDELTFTTIANEDTYYVNRLTNALDPDFCLNDGSQPVRLIESVWWGSTKVHKKQKDEFYLKYQGISGASTPVNWTAFGNIFKLGPVPGGAYELTIPVKRQLNTIEQFPEMFQYAPIYAAIMLMLNPNSQEYGIAKDRYDLAIKTIRSADGMMDFTDESRSGYAR